MRRARPALWLVMAGCVRIPAENSDNPVDCDARTLGEGEVRARRIPCTDEALADGDARMGDWMLENSRVRYGIRGAYGPLTRLAGAGGTVVDAAPPGGADALTEATPLLGGLWFQVAEITAWNEADRAGLTVEGTLSDGADATLTYALEPDAVALTLEGADGILLVPHAGSARWGEVVEADADALDPGAALWVAAPGSVTDSGGWVQWDGAGLLAVGAPDDVAQELWPDGLDVSGAAEGTWVEALDGAGEVLTRMAVADGAYAGRVPAETAALRATAEGYADGPASAPGAALTLGGRGVLRVRVTDQGGADIPATLWWNGASWPLPAGGGDAPVGPGVGEAILSAGPAYEAEIWPDLAVSDVVRLEAVLAAAVTRAVLAQLSRAGWPDPTERHRAEDLLFAEAAQGVGFAVLVADDEVAPVAFDRHTETALRASGGSRAPDASFGTPVAWPWSANARQPAHGAADRADLDAIDLLSAMAGVGDRRTVVSPAWAAAAGPPYTWDPSPTALRLSSLDDLPAYTALLDAWAPLAATGPLTWVEDLLPDPYAAVDVGSALVAGRTTATNGPRVVLRVAGEGPGARVTPRGPVAVHLRVEAPAWIPLMGAALITGDGVVVAQWTLSGDAATRLDARLTATPDRYLLAVCWGDSANPPLLADPAWAVTSPVWVSPR